MDRGGVAHGEMDECEQSVGASACVNKSKRTKLVSIVRTDPFTPGVAPKNQNGGPLKPDSSGFVKHEFEERLVNDGNGGLCTSRRISPYMMAAAGMPIANLPPGYYTTSDGEPRPKSLPAFSTMGDWRAA